MRPDDRPQFVIVQRVDPVLDVLQFLGQPCPQHFDVFCFFMMIETARAVGSPGVVPCVSEDLGEAIG